MMNAEVDIIKNKTSLWNIFSLNEGESDNSETIWESILVWNFDMSTATTLCWIFWDDIEYGAI